MGYWPEKAEALIHRIQDTREDLWNDRKADLLAEEFSKICGNDSLYIIVYDECGGYDNHSFNAVIDQTTVKPVLEVPAPLFFVRFYGIYSFRRGRCNVVVYRSVEWNSGGRDHLGEISREVDSCKNGFIPLKRFYDDFPAWIMKYRVHNTRFMGMIAKERNAIVRSVNSNTEWGPGWWVTATAFNPSTLTDTQWKFTLVAGWK